MNSFKSTKQKIDKPYSVKYLENNLVRFKTFKYWELKYILITLLMIEQVKSQVSLGVKEKAAMNYQYSKRNLISNPGNHHQSNQKLAN